MSKKSTFSRELPEKSTRGHTDFIYGIELSLCGKALCKRTEIIETFFHDNHGYGKVLSLKMGKNRLFQEGFQKNPPEVTQISYMYGIESLLCGNNFCKRREIIKIRLPR
jgi:hypothetical protein